MGRDFVPEEMRCMLGWVFFVCFFGCGYALSVPAKTISIFFSLKTHREWGEFRVLHGMS